MNLEKYLNLAEMARKDPSLIPNHRGTVDRALREELLDIEEVLSHISDGNDFEFINRMKEGRDKIKIALLVYNEA